MSDIIEINNDNFNNLVLKNTKPIIVDFWAEWCNPCKIFIPILEKIAIQYQDSLSIYKINIDNCNNIATKYSIQSIPTLLFFKNGNLIFTKIGIISKSEIQKLINIHFNII